MKVYKAILSDEKDKINIVISGYNKVLAREEAKKYFRKMMGSISGYKLTLKETRFVQ